MLSFDAVAGMWKPGSWRSVIDSREKVEEKPPVHWPVLVVKITRASSAKHGLRR